MGGSTKQNEEIEKVIKNCKSSRPTLEELAVSYYGDHPPKLEKSKINIL